MSTVPEDPRAEAVLYLEWVRGASGRFVDVDATRPTAAATVSGVGSEASFGRGSDLASKELVHRVARLETRQGAESSSPVTPGDGAPVRSIIGHAGVLSGLPGVASLDELRPQVESCRRCRLCESRQRVVFGEGAPRPRLVVIGEAPGADEDASGRPFVGKAGQLLTRMLAAIGLDRADVFIGNVLKCRPPENRPPASDEVLACRPFLEAQLTALRPELVLLLGNHATKAVLRTDRGITALRGRIATSAEGWRVLPTYHPAYLLRTPDAKREAWADLQLAARTLGLPPVGRDAASAGGAGSAANAAGAGEGPTDGGARSDTEPRDP